MSKDLIRYDLMVQDALKSVLRKLLTEAARDGLPGDHHFYITFRTEAPGVRLSQRMREKYPDEMTVVLQHQFWDLGVTEHAFEVGLSFGGVPERLLVPFDSITGFFDPSVKFGLKFELHDEGQAVPEPETAMPKRPLLASVPSEPARLPAMDKDTSAKVASAKASKSGPKPVAQDHEPAPDQEDAPKVAGRKPAAKAAGVGIAGGKGQDENQAKTKVAAKDKDRLPVNAAAPDEAPKDGTAQIVSLDAFRKKT